jgi:hypothetical protein
MVNQYYDLATDFYERGWGQSFHFAPRFEGEAFAASLARHEHYLALRSGLARGRPRSTWAAAWAVPCAPSRASRAPVVDGLNNNDYQLSKLARYNAEARLDHLCRGIKGDFMKPCRCRRELRRRLRRGGHVPRARQAWGSSARSPRAQAGRRASRCTSGASRTATTARNPRTAHQARHRVGRQPARHDQHARRAGRRALEAGLSWWRTARPGAERRREHALVPAARGRQGSASRRCAAARPAAS